MRLTLQLATPLAETAGRILALTIRARKELTARIELQHDGVAEFSLSHKTYSVVLAILEIRREMPIEVVARQEGFEVSHDFTVIRPICLLLPKNGVDVEG